MSSIGLRFGSTAIEERGKIRVSVGEEIIFAVSAGDTGGFSVEQLVSIQYDEKENYECSSRPFVVVSPHVPVVSLSCRAVVSSRARVLGIAKSQKVG